MIDLLTDALECLGLLLLAASAGLVAVRYGTAAATCAAGVTTIVESALLVLIRQARR